jgi:hypothetical protein
MSGGVTASQTERIHMIIEHLAYQGVMDPALPQPIGCRRPKRT